jgi:hypothetical protein
MPQVFHRSANVISRASIVGGGLLTAVLFVGGWFWVRSSYVTGTNIPRDQPIAFSHKHHVGEEGFDCRYCHTSVETSTFAGIPSTKICMNCHSQIWSGSPFLEPVRASWASGQPIVWNRVNDLPDFTYFNHSIHIYKGVGCETCHGRVDQMPLTWKQNTLQMEWCLGCHKDPAKYVRPREEVYTMGYQPAEPQSVLGPRLVKQYNIQSKTDCWFCHR